MDKEFHELDDQQKAKVEYLFADASFNTNPENFLYEIDSKGNVSGRRNKTPEAQAPLRRASKKTEVKVIVLPVPELEITPEIVGTMETNMDALAAYMARNIFNNQINAGGEQ